MMLPFCRITGSYFMQALLLKPPKEEQDEHDYQERPQDTSRGIAPAPAVGPGRKGADEKEDEYDNQNGAEHGSSPFWLA